MAKKDNIISTYKDVRSKLMDIQKQANEPLLFPTLKQLFVTMGFLDVEITHGRDEYGRDLVFRTNTSPFGNEQWYAVVVKNKNTKAEDFEDGGEILRQIKLCFEYPWFKGNGEEVYANQVIVVINGTETNNAKNILSKILQPHQRNNVTIWNYQLLESNIEKHIKDLFLAGKTGTQEEYEVNLYKERMTAKLSSLDNAKELFAGYTIQDINDIFVNVRTATRQYEQERNKYSDTPLTVRGEIDDSISIINAGRNTIIRGIPTSGKTILLKRIGVNALQKYPSIAVFWFRFRNIDVEHFSLDEAIKNQYAEFSNGGIFDESKFTKTLLLFDALDEIKNEETRKTIITKINEQSTNHAKFVVIVTGRNIDLFDDSYYFESYDKCDLLPFNIGQAFNLVKKLIPNDKEKSTRFINAIKKHQLSYSLTRTPMALTLMAIMYKDNSIDLAELPANITELYSKFSDYYLDKWDASKGLSAQYKYEEVKNIMGFISNHLHENHTYFITSGNLKEFLIELKGSHSFDELEDVDAYMSQLKERNTLLCYDSQHDRFYFLGASFQEYFTSIYYDDSNEDDLLDRTYDEWWQNVIIFYNGKNPKRTVFIDKMMTKQCPIDGYSMFQHINIMSNCLQAANLIPNSTEKKGIANIIYNFDRFYKFSLNATLNGTNIAYQWTTLDMILQFRKLFLQLFSSRHIKIENFKDVVNDIFNNHLLEYSEVTLYCIAYHILDVERDSSLMAKFLEIPDYNTRWDRIICKDIEHKRLENTIPKQIWNRVKRKQKSNKNYIDKQFKEPAILHLADGTKLVEIKY